MNIPSYEFWIGLSIGVLGILVTILIAIYQTKSPRLNVACLHAQDGNPAALACEVRNDGRGEARNVLISFNNMLPVATKVFAGPEVGAQIVEAEAPPDPALGPAAAALRMAFAVQIPRVSAKSTVRFEVRTTDADNQRAAGQVLRIRHEIAGILAEFGTRLKAKYPQLASMWNSDVILAARIKEESFFSPASISYERGIERIPFFTAEEELARANSQDLYARYKAEFIDVFQGKPRFIAPVVRVKTGEGDRTYAIFPPYVPSGLEMKVPVSQLKAEGKMFVYPPVPQTYD
jgi:hypothetical protein